MVSGINSLYYSMLISQRTSNILWCNIPVKGRSRHFKGGCAQSDIHVRIQLQKLSQKWRVTHYK